MAKKASSKQRIQRKAAEAEATAKEKEEKKTTKKAPAKKAAAKTTAKTTAKKVAKKTTKKTTKKKAASRRLKVVWKVYNASFKDVGTFAYTQRGEADKSAEKLQEKSGTYHFVNAVKVPLEDEA